MATGKKMTAEEAMSQIAFVTWEHAIEAVTMYNVGKTRELEKDIDAKKDYAKDRISEIAKFEIGNQLSQHEFEKYVKLHRELRDTMKDIRLFSKKVSCETQEMVNDSMKLIDLKRPRYLSFLKKERVPEDDDTPISITMRCLISLTVIALLVCYIFKLNVYSLGNHFNIVSYANF